MTLIPRNKADDTAALPDYETERKALADFTDPRSSARADSTHYIYERTLGDLIVDALAGRDLVDDVEFAPEAWESFECALLKRTALELKAANLALAVHLTTDDHAADGLSVADSCELLRGLARRAEAAAEISKRLREARWGHPHFGGSPTRPQADDRKTAAELGREEGRHWAEETKRGVAGISADQWAASSFKDQGWAFAAEAPSLDEESAREAFRAGFAMEIQKYGCRLADDMRDDAAVKAAANDGGE